jgi:hypothetical protein
VQKLFKFDSISFVNSCFYFLSYWSSTQKIINYASIFKGFLLAVSKCQAFDAFWIDFCTGWGIGI